MPAGNLMYPRVMLIAVTLSASLTSVDAARVRRQSLTEIRDRAAAIVVADVIGITSRVGETGTMTWTDYEVRVVESLRGKESSGEAMTLTFAGGRAGGLDIGVSGVPRLVIGSRYLFFVDRGDALTMPTIGWGQGLYSIVSSANGEMLTSSDGESLAISSDRKLVRVGRGNALPRSKRLQIGRSYNGDGTPRARRSLSFANAAPQTRRATLSDVRAFVRGEISEAPFSGEKHVH